MLKKARDFGRPVIPSVFDSIKAEADHDGAAVE
jgi:hypothetical protein